MNKNYIVPDLLATDLKLVFCGTAPSTISAKRKAYYANPGNKFWSALHQAGFTKNKIDPKNYKDLLQYKIGLTDLCKCYSGNDDDLNKEWFDKESLLQKILHYRPKYLAFTSKTAARIFLSNEVSYGMQDFHVGTTLCYVLPSTSGRASRFWNIEHWKNLHAALDS